MNATDANTHVVDIRDADDDDEDDDDVILVTTSPAQDKPPKPMPAVPAHSVGAACSTDTGNRSGKTTSRRLSTSRTQYKVTRLHTETPKKRRRSFQQQAAAPEDIELQMGPPTAIPGHRLDASGAMASTAAPGGCASGATPGAAHQIDEKPAGSMGGSWQARAVHNYSVSDMVVCSLNGHAPLGFARYGSLSTLADSYPVATTAAGGRVGGDSTSVGSHSRGASPGGGQVGWASEANDSRVRQVILEPAPAGLLGCKLQRII